MIFLLKDTRPEKYQRYKGCDTCTLMYHNYVHVEMEVDFQPNVWICSQRAIQRKLISKHLILFHKDSNEILERKKERKLYKIKTIN